MCRLGNLQIQVLGFYLMRNKNHMKHISILVPQRAILGSLEGSRQLFTQVNQFMLQQNRGPCFQVQLVGITKETRVAGSCYTVHSDVLLSQVGRTDLIVIPAVDGDIVEAIELNKEMLPFLKYHYEQGAEIASLCMGAFILASTGLLNGRKCATHWLAANAFRTMFPQVNLVTESIITDEQGIYSSGGAFSYLNLILYLIEKYTHRDMAILAAKVFAIEIDRINQSSFILFEGQKNHEDEPIRQAQEFIEKNFSEKMTIDELALMFAIGRRHFERRFKKATNNTPSEYIQRVKVEAAKKKLEVGRKNVNEVMYEVGYSDTKAFRSVFKKVTGLLPMEYRNKYSKGMN